MRSPERVLNSLSEHSKDASYKFERLYRILFNEEMFYVAYQRIYAKEGNMTKGSDGQTIDNMSLKRIEKLIDTLKDETYQPQPSKRVYIPKKNGKKRPLGVPTFNDKLIQEVVRMVLEAIYEGNFEYTSHGFRPNRSCHTALTHIQKEFNGAKWFVEGDIKGFFDNINHDVLINILLERIADERFIRLIRKFMKAGYIEDWQFHNTYSGTPQGGIISPILANIYLDKLDKYIKEYRKDAEGLCAEPATCNPRATEHIPQIIKLVETLIEKGHAYPVANGDVYFSVRSFPGYGKLSGQSIDDLESGARIEPGDLKRDPLDFALWKGAKPGEPAWDCPWGKGRPGWHIECSAMSMELLGPTFDIHAGGQDLIFPHHENEIAQSEAATGKPFARYWMHNGYINVDNQKMSKSLGNFRLVRDIAQEFDLEAVRLFLLSAQYRNPINFTRELIEQANTALTRIRTARERLAEAKEGPATAEDESFIASLAEHEKRFCDAMDDDLNTADALGAMFDYARAVNTFVTEPRSKEALERAAKLFDDMTNVLGILQHSKSEEFPKEAVALLNERAEARKAKNWARADQIREELKAMGFAVEDSKEGAKLKRL